MRPDKGPRTEDRGSRIEDRGRSGAACFPRFSIFDPRSSILIWALVLVGIGVRVAVAPRSHNLYPVFADAGRHWVAGAGLYEFRPWVEPFRYSPLVAVLFAPFGLLPDLPAALLWRLVSVAVFLGGLGWFCRSVLPGALTPSRRAVLLLLVLPLEIGSINNGQSNALVIGLLLLGVAAVADRRWTLAAAAVALACLFKLYPVAVGLLLAALYPRRFSWRLALALAAGFALPFLVQRSDYVIDQYGGWLNHLSENPLRRFLPADLRYRDFRLLCDVCGVAVGDRTVLRVQLLAAALTGVVCVGAALARWPRRRRLTLLLNLGCCWMTVFGPASESSTYTLLAPTAAWALLAAWTGRRLPGVRGLVLASYLLLLCAQVGNWFPREATMLIMSAQPLAALLLFLTLPYAELRDFSRPEVGPNSPETAPAQAA
jgi:hypothetical protein